ncbi:hypothetical protein [Shewanella sp. Isolate8]|uniref:hypothetical protein n=1 Tax=Shewanella sp. Isolate8 TaxID=2908529 RepID=UPI001EFD1F7E|nr:hypothetical protein [Shewanella sp. Isolate8]MCG9747696.1 hypothetical protein [Shewanella sp. Isolate8]
MRLNSLSPLLGFVVNRTLYASSEAYRQRIDYICKLISLAGGAQHQTHPGPDKAEVSYTRRERQASQLGR